VITAAGLLPRHLPGAASGELARQTHAAPEAALARRIV
jgi:hypothetical protein